MEARPGEVLEAFLITATGDGERLAGLAVGEAFVVTAAGDGARFGGDRADCTRLRMALLPGSP